MRYVFHVDDIDLLPMICDPERHKANFLKVFGQDCVEINAENITKCDLMEIATKWSLSWRYNRILENRFGSLVPEYRNGLKGQDLVDQIYEMAQFAKKNGLKSKPRTLEV